jgi:hypothetical protein
MSNQSGTIQRVDMELVTNLHAYAKESKFTPDGYPRNDRVGDNRTGLNTGSANTDEKVSGNFASAAMTSYRGKRS